MTTTGPVVLQFGDDAGNGAPRQSGAATRTEEIRECVSLLQEATLEIGWVIGKRYYCWTRWVGGGRMGMVV